MSFFRTYTQHKGENLPFSHDFAPYTTAHSTTVSTAAVQNASGVTVSTEALADTLYSAQLSTPTVGRFTFELKATFADGTIQIMEFQVQVKDPEVRR